MNNDTEHAEFEEAYRENYPVTCQINTKKFQRDGHEYDDTTVAIAFKLFKAGRSAPQREACAVPDGWKLVPIEPTEEMLIAGQEAWMCTHAHDATIEECKQSEATYGAMIAATPPAPTQAQHTGEAK